MDWNGNPGWDKMISELHTFMKKVVFAAQVHNMLLAVMEVKASVLVGAPGTHI